MQRQIPNFRTVAPQLTLEEKEKLLGELIFEEASEVVSSLPNNPNDEDHQDADFAEKIELTRDNLSKISEAFKAAENAREDFHRSYPDFYHCRNTNISNLRQLACSINNDRFNCNIVKATSSSVGIVGGAALAVNVICPPAGATLAVVGGMTSLASGAITAGTSVGEVYLLKKKMEEAKATIDKDKEQFKPMAKWFKHSQDLVDLMNQIVGFSVFEEVFEGLKKIKSDCTDFRSLKEGSMYSRLKELIKTFVLSAVSVGAAAGSSQLALLPAVTAFVFVFILFRKSNNLLFGTIVLTQRTALGLMTFFNAGSGLGTLICKAAAKSGVAAAEGVGKAVAKTVGQGALIGLGMVLDVANLVHTSIDIHNGSVSEHAVHLNDVSDQLKKELTVVKTAYDCLFSGPPDR